MLMPKTDPFMVQWLSSKTTQSPLPGVPESSVWLWSSELQATPSIENKIQIGRYKGRLRV